MPDHLESYIEGVHLVQLFFFCVTASKFWLLAPHRCAVGNNVAHGVSATVAEAQGAQGGQEAGGSQGAQAAPIWLLLLSFLHGCAAICGMVVATSKLCEL